MNKYLPSILLATVIVSGIFAFMPIQQASTIHTSIQSTQSILQKGTFDASSIALTPANHEIEVTSANDFCILDVQMEFADLDADDDLSIDGIQINDIEIVNDGAVIDSAFFFADQGTFTSIVGSMMFGLTDKVDEPVTLCAEGGEIIDILLDDGTGNGDLIAGEITNVVAYAEVDGNAEITVSIGTRD